MLIEFIVSYEHPVEAVEQEEEQWEGDSGLGVHLQGKNKSKIDVKIKIVHPDSDLLIGHSLKLLLEPILGVIILVLIIVLCGDVHMETFSSLLSHSFDKPSPKLPGLAFSPSFLIFLHIGLAWTWISRFPCCALLALYPSIQVVPKKCIDRTKS